MIFGAPVWGGPKFSGPRFGDCHYFWAPSIKTLGDARAIKKNDEKRSQLLLLLYGSDVSRVARYGSFR